ncbi:MAG: hypothetical protein KKB30_04395 [Proteobacteria bacterium]|nr:hypothetical protein [Pseudomonadota bacterium]MBU1716468.1 hypothetical protein [Pseudomonadota bacterium]
MRITMQTIHQNILGNLNRITSSMNDINQQISSGKQMSRPSDDPVNMAGALSLRSSLAEIMQFQENLMYGGNVITASENALVSTKELVMRAKVLALQDVNAPMTAQNRLNAVEEVRNLFEQALSLSNSQVNGKFIFGGYRTTGYTDTEPTPFLQDLVDGHRINGYTPAAMTTGLNATMAAGNIAPGDLAVNGNPTVGAIITVGPTNGLFMDKAASAKAEIMAADPVVTVALTTLNEGGATTADGGGGSQFFFYLNDVPLTVNISAGANQATVAGETAAAINSISDLTGVTAVVGDGTNGGTDNTRVVLRNSRVGDESNIAVSSFNTLVAGGADLGFGNFVQGADATHNTGQISISSAQGFELASPNNPADDSILNSLGLGGGGVGFADDSNDGILVYGNRLATGDLWANGLPVSAATADGISDVLADASAAAKAAAINGDFATTGVRAEVTTAYRMATQAVTAGTEATALTGLLNNTAIAAGDLAINGTILGVINTAAPVDGLNMTKAVNAKAEINLQATTTGVTARLTTLSAAAVPAAVGSVSDISFDLNGVAISYTTSSAPLQDSVLAINSVIDQTGVRAFVGNGNNGAPAGVLGLKNALSGDESNIVIAGYNGGTGTATTGLADVNQAPDATHNTGEVSLFSDTLFRLTSPNNPNDDSILDALGLGGGQIQTGISGDLAADGFVNYGSTPAVLSSGDLVINGVDIFEVAHEVAGKDVTNSLMMTINAKQGLTGVYASSSDFGGLLLSAVDGRNLHVQTSSHGESVTHINGGSPPVGQDRVYFGSLILSSDREFFLETTPSGSGYEAGLAALGLDGGTVNSGEPGDVAGDGLIAVTSIIKQDGNVRYTGDRQNDFEVRIGSKSTLAVGKNGEDAIANTGVFTVLQGLEDALLGQNFRKIVSPYQAVDPKATLASTITGLDQSEQYTNGTFNVSVTDHEYYPPRVFSMSIAVDASVDTFESMAQKINGIPNLKAAWDSDGHLRVETVDQKRYSLTMTDGDTNFLKKIGITFDQFQVQALQQSISDLDDLQNTMTSQVSDFGARANRIIVQKEIFASLEVTTTENLSEKEDTDMIKALMQLQAKEVAYEAALSAASKTMQLSLVNFL